jgi:hypothetical protein
MADRADRDIADPQGHRLTEPRMRASDADRHATVLVLQDAMARGLLTPDEAGERMAAAFAAVHRGDLEPMTADLPHPPAKTGGSPGWRILTMMAIEQLRALFRHNDTGRLNRARVALAVLLAILLLLVLGLSAIDLSDGGAPRDPGGFGRR